MGYGFYKLVAKDPDASSPEFLKYGIAEPVTAIAKDGRNVNESIQAHKVTPFSSQACILSAYFSHH